jgi:hypothetical protein
MALRENHPGMVGQGFFSFAAQLRKRPGLSGTQIAQSDFIAPFLRDFLPVLVKHLFFLKSTPVSVASSFLRWRGDAALAHQHFFSKPPSIGDSIPGIGKIPEKHSNNPPGCGIAAVWLCRFQ